MTNTVVNVTRVTNVYNIYNSNQRNVTNITYVNQRVNNGVTFVSRDTFVNARPVNRNLGHFDARQFANAPIERRVPVQPIRASVLGSGAPARFRPPQAVINRQVVATQRPASPRQPFEQRQATINMRTERPNQAQPLNQGTRPWHGRRNPCVRRRTRKRHRSGMPRPEARPQRPMAPQAEPVRPQAAPTPPRPPQGQARGMTKIVLRRAGRIPRRDPRLRCSKGTKHSRAKTRTNSATGSNSASRLRHHRTGRCSNSISRHDRRKTGRNSRAEITLRIASLR